MNTIKMVHIIVLLLLTTTVVNADGNATLVNPEDAVALRYEKDNTKVFPGHVSIEKNEPTLREVYEHAVSQLPDWNKPMYMLNPRRSQAMLASQKDTTELYLTENDVTYKCSTIRTDQEYDWFEETGTCKAMVKSLSWWQMILLSGLIGMCTIWWTKRKKIVAKTEG